MMGGQHVPLRQSVKGKGRGKGREGVGDVENEGNEEGDEGPRPEW